ncbi:MAG: amino acid ABC transporter permease [Austwickia sp.]|jgi:polar amino acid transport system permease protein|nr:amino acid ABC transporter permease [Austwickia sp.]MBK8435824.1 amino acid ABC transporter permease [Austwickia sp.]MBK9101510.1 amino acid ABC transporter permease [Austwickia sp.]
MTPDPGPTTGSHYPAERPGDIHARPVPHPGRWVGAGVVLVLAAMFVSSLLTNPRWDLGLAGQIMIQTPVLEGLLKGTIIATVASMTIGVLLGTLVAVLRLSTNPVMRYLSFLYTWFFRAIPRYVLLTGIGAGLAYLYQQVDVGVPFGQQLAGALGLSHDLTFFSVDMVTVANGLVGGIIGLGLSEAAYMAEIARAGILSVDKGQSEAAEALGMSRGQVMRRIILPQAMRVIVPPTGNETIAMVKDTSLLIAIPVISELNFQAMAIGNRMFKVMGGLVAATVWYLIVCSVLMVIQVYVERYFGRGFGAERVGAQRNRRYARAGGMGGA